MAERDRGVGIVGARALPDSYREQIREVVSYLLEHSYLVHTGGAMGADQFALDALIELGAISRGVLFTPWTGLEGFPRAVQRQVQYYTSHRGRVSWGSVPHRASRGTVIAGLLHRNERLVRASYGVVAFLHGESKGTSRTVREACRRGLRVVVFLCGDAVLPEVSGSWVQLSCDFPWSGVYLFRR